MMARAKAMRSKLLNFRVTPEEKKLIEKRASSKKMTLAEYVREAVFMDMLLSVSVRMFSGDARSRK